MVGITALFWTGIGILALGIILFGVGMKRSMDTTSFSTMFFVGQALNVIGGLTSLITGIIWIVRQFA